MKEELSSLLDASIQLELNVAELYRIFHTAYPNDADFMMPTFGGHCLWKRIAAVSFVIHGQNALVPTGELKK